MNITYRILKGAIAGAILAGAFCLWMAGADHPHEKAQAALVKIREGR